MEVTMRNNIIARIMKDESGATAIEYALIAALVSMAAITAYTAMGGSIRQFFNDMSGILDGTARQG
jgi:pilus assembly protein Flp/PilA